MPSSSKYLCFIVSSGLTVMVAAALLHPLLPHLTTWHLLGAFHDSHTWVFRHLYDILSGSQPLSLATDGIGFPDRVELRAMGLFPALLALPFQPWMGALGSYNLVLLLSPGLAALAAALFFTRGLGMSRGVATGAALAYGLCPFALGAMASGQVAKLQHWLLPAFLWAISASMRSRRAWGGLAALALLLLMASFTAPSVVVFFPFAGLVWVTALLAASLLRAPAPGQKKAWRSGLLRILGILSVGGLALLPARQFYGDLRSGNGPQAFEPHVVQLDPSANPSPVARPETMLWQEVPAEHDPRQAIHVSYVGLPFILLALLLSIKPFPGRWRLWSLVVVGALLALGPRLVVGDSFFLVGGRTLALPLRYLEQLGFPTARTGMYYRAIIFCSLGLSGILGSALDALGWRRAWILAWLLGAAQLADGIRITRSLWPRPVEPVPAVDLLRDMARDPRQGAVLELPLESGTWEGGLGMLSAIYHQRATTSLPRQSRRYLPRVARLMALWERVGSSDDRGRAQQMLQDAGFRFVLWRPNDHDRREKLELYRSVLGVPVESDGLLLWTVDAARWGSSH